MHITAGGLFEFEKIFDDETKDVNLIDKLTTPEELSGLLNLAIAALKRVIYCRQACKELFHHLCKKNSKKQLFH